MATFGNSTTPTFGNFFYGINVQNAVWSIFTMPSPGGYITNLSAYFDTETGSGTSYAVIWNGSTGALMTDANLGSVSSGSNSAGGQAWHSGTVSSYYIAGGTSLAMGFWTPQANGLTTSFYNTGSCFSGTQSGSGPGTASGPSTGHGAIGVYATYNPLTAPTISSITPSVAASGSSITIAGTGFQYATALTIGGVTPTYTINSDSQIVATVPSGISGTVTVTVTNPAGSGSATMSVGEVYYGDVSGSGAVHSIVAVWYGDPSGSGAVHQAVGIWVPNGGGVKRIW